MALIAMNSTNATIMKLITLLMKTPDIQRRRAGLPRLGERIVAAAPFSVMKMLQKSTPPVTTPIGGMMMSSTSDLTMVEKAAPMMMPTAMSTTLPRSANSLNSL